MSVRPVIVGVAGGSGSGKSTIVAELVRLLGLGITTVIRHDWYYRDLSHLELDDRTEVNFDHPSSLETELLVKHVMTLISRCPVDAPSYDFATHTRSSVTIQLEPSQVLILDGILALAHEQLRELMDICVFVDTDVKKRLERRLERDSGERGRSPASVTVTAANRNYVNWARGGNFNPSGRVSIPSVTGDGTGVFGATVTRTFEMVVDPDSSGAAYEVPACPTS